MAGIVIVLLGLVRLGWVVDLIPVVSISAFMTGSALSIAAGQLPVLLGVKGFSTRESTFRVFYNTLLRISSSNIDAVVGLSALAILYAVRQMCTVAGARYPKQAKVWFFASTLRTAGIIALYTTMSYIFNRNRRSQPLFSILRTVPAGFQNIAIPTVNAEIFSIFAGHLPALVLVLLLEHIAIAKSFGRLNNYTIDASQEMVAIGITNVLGPFLGAYPATGSFSRTAIKSKAGVKTPLAGVITAAFVLAAIYALPAVFFYIPNAALAAVIIHAVLDLTTSPSTVVQYWQLAPAEVPIFFLGVLVTIFCDIESGIYTTVSVSFLLLVVRWSFAKSSSKYQIEEHQPLLLHDDIKGHTPTRDDVRGNTCAFLRQNNLSSLGILIFTPSSSLTFLSVNSQFENFVKDVFATTRRTNLTQYSHLSQRPWNDTEPLNGKNASNHGARPTLKAIIVDWSKVDVLDLTAVMRLLDVKKQLDMYATPETVQWFFANVGNTTMKRALLSADFGCIPRESGVKDATSINCGYGTLATVGTELEKSLLEDVEERSSDEPLRKDSSSSKASQSSREPSTRRAEDVGCTQRCLSSDGFYPDLASAEHAAMVNIHFSRPENGTVDLSDGILCNDDEYYS